MLPEKVPDFFRSGMNASIDFKAEGKENALLIPVDAAHKENNKTYVLVSEDAQEAPVKRYIKLGITDDKNFEVLSGLEQGDKIIIKEKKYVLPTNKTGTNPFMPARQQQQRRKAN